MKHKTLIVVTNRASALSFFPLRKEIENGQASTL
jgi:hypothetical protein